MTLLSTLWTDKRALCRQYLLSIVLKSQTFVAMEVREIKLIRAKHKTRMTLNRGHHIGCRQPCERLTRPFLYIGTSHQVNSNPCLEFVCPLLRGMIGRVIDDTLSVALDPVFRPPQKHRGPSTLRMGESAADLPGFGFSKVYPAK